MSQCYLFEFTTYISVNIFSVMHGRLLMEAVLSSRNREGSLSAFQIG